MKRRWVPENGMELVRKFVSDQTGAGLIEYALVACLVGLAAVAALTTVGLQVQNSVWVGISKVYSAYESQ